MRFHIALTKFFLLFTNISITVVWAPLDVTLDRSRLASFIAEEAAYGSPPDGLDCIQSVAFQKDQARKIAFRNWERDFFLDRTLEAFNFRWQGLTPSHAYLHAIVEPPSEIHHPLWREATRTQLDSGLKTKKPLYRRHTTSTAIQLAVDHAFTVTYATCFHPSDPPESMRCPCGKPTRSPTHIILECPLFAEDRANSLLVSSHSWRPLGLLLAHLSLQQLKLLTWNSPRALYERTQVSDFHKTSLRGHDTFLYIYEFAKTASVLTLQPFSLSSYGRGPLYNLFS